MQRKSREDALVIDSQTAIMDFQPIHSYGSVNQFQALLKFIN